MMSPVRILYLEPFDTGSHAQFGRVLTQNLDAEWTVLTLPGRHWKWRMRGAMLHFAESHRGELAADYDLVLASSFIPLAELIAFAPGLAGVPKILYFHENQLTYPVRDEQERDTHFGFTQIVSASLADLCLFNSEFNRTSFLAAAGDLIGRMPDAHPNWALAQIEARSEVLAVPMDLPPHSIEVESPHPDGPLILWNHRWEHDKNPELFFEVLGQLAAEGVPYRVAVCGERFRRAPEVFESAETQLASRTEHWGYLKRDEYEALLKRADCVVSTAHHEFFGVSVLEAVHFGCRPFVPNRLSYPELFPPSYRYANDAELLSRLRDACLSYRDSAVEMRRDRSELTSDFSVETVLPRYSACFRRVISQGHR